MLARLHLRTSEVNTLCERLGAIIENDISSRSLKMYTVGLTVNVVLALRAGARSLIARRFARLMRTGLQHKFNMTIAGACASMKHIFQKVGAEMKHQIIHTHHVTLRTKPVHRRCPAF